MKINNWLRRITEYRFNIIDLFLAMIIQGLIIDLFLAMIIQGLIDKSYPSIAIITALIFVFWLAP